MKQGRLVSIARRDRKRAPMEVLDRARITGAAGVEGDFRGRPGKRQVTVLAAEDWQAACTQLGRTLPWTDRRANLLIEGIRLPHRTGSRLVIGEAVLEITGELDPCSRMDEASEGLLAALTPDWRGGVTCRVVADGDVRVGDAVDMEQEDVGQA
ncbi:MAG: MOSC domain-containing protein [Gammaproteobacteria bacterium]